MVNYKVMKQKNGKPVRLMAEVATMALALKHKESLDRKDKRLGNDSQYIIIEGEGDIVAQPVRLCELESLTQSELVKVAKALGMRLYVRGNTRDFLIKNIRLHAALQVLRAITEQPKGEQ